MVLNGISSTMTYNPTAVSEVKNETMEISVMAGDVVTDGTASASIDTVSVIRTSTMPASRKILVDSVPVRTSIAGIFDLTVESDQYTGRNVCELGDADERWASSSGDLVAADSEVQSKRREPEHHSVSEESVIESGGQSNQSGQSSQNQHLVTSSNDANREEIRAITSALTDADEQSTDGDSVISSCSSSSSSCSSSVSSLAELDSCNKLGVALFTDMSMEAPATPTEIPITNLVCLESVKEAKLEVTTDKNVSQEHSVESPKEFSSIRPTNHDLTVTISDAKVESRPRTLYRFANKVIQNRRLLNQANTSEDYITSKANSQSMNHGQKSVPDISIHGRLQVKVLNDPIELGNHHNVVSVSSTENLAMKHVENANIPSSSNIAETKQIIPHLWKNQLHSTQGVPSVHDKMDNSDVIENTSLHVDCIVNANEKDIHCHVQTETLLNDSIKQSLHMTGSTSPNFCSQPLESKQNSEYNPFPECQPLVTRRYRLDKPTTSASRWISFLRTLGISQQGRINESSSQVDDDATLCCGISPNRLMIDFLHWLFRRSFLVFFLSSVALFWVLTTIFATAIYVLGKRMPDCIGGTDFLKDGFTDAYALSWTTFSTVGYGMIYPAISHETDNIRHCTVITVLVSWEAFVGMLYASFCSAILFIKVSRIQSFAQVAFSDKIVVRYGSGVKRSDSDASLPVRNENSVFAINPSDRIPLPVLEFRIVNIMHNVMDGEIIDCTVNIVASIDARQAVASTNDPHRHIGLRKGRKLKHHRHHQNQNRTNKKIELKRLERIEGNSSPLDIEVGDGSSSRSYDMPSLLTSYNKLSSTTNTSSDKNKKFDDDVDIHPNTGRKRVFTKLNIELPEHPFFKRVWTIRHILDQNSPLLKPHYRELIKRNHGYWPDELNNYESVRNSFHFDSFLVSFSGTSYADGNSVYAQYVYDFDDVNIGCSFRGMLIQDGMKVFVDMKLLHEISDQVGRSGKSSSIDKENVAIRKANKVLSTTKHSTDKIDVL